MVVQRRWARGPGHCLASSPMVKIFAANLKIWTPGSKGEGARERERAEFSIAIWRKRFLKGFVPIHKIVVAKSRFFQLLILFLP